YPNGFGGAPQRDGFVAAVVCTGAGAGAGACVVGTTGFAGALVAGALVTSAADGESEAEAETSCVGVLCVVSCCSAAVGVPVLAPPQPVTAKATQRPRMLSAALNPPRDFRSFELLPTNADDLFGIRRPSPVRQTRSSVWRHSGGQCGLADWA